MGENGGSCGGGEQSGSRGPYDKADDIKTPAGLWISQRKTVVGSKEHHFPTGELTSCGTAKANKNPGLWTLISVDEQPLKKRRTTNRHYWIFQVMLPFFFCCFSPQTGKRKIID